MRKLRVLFCLILFICLTSASCAAGSENEISENDSTVSENAGTEETMPPPSDADSWTEYLLNAISEKDAEGAAALFAKRLQTATLTDQITEMFAYMQGSVLSHNYMLGMTSQSNHGGIVKETDVKIDIVAEENEYRLAVRIRLIDESNPANIGITSLYITEASKTERNFAYWGGYVWNPGINIE